MTISVRKLFEKCKKYDIKLISGEGGLNNQVSWIHILEEKKMLDFLKGFELVFTTGIGIKGATDDELVSFATSLIEKKSSGWVINIGHYIDNVPEKLKNFCNEKNFPIFTIPWHEKLIDITYELSRTIIINEDRSLSIFESFSNLIFHKGDVEHSIDVLEGDGFKEDDKYQIVYINPKLDPNQDVLDLSQIEPKITTLSKYVMFKEKNNIVVIMDNSTNDDVEDMIDQIEEAFEKNRNYSIGISNQIIGLCELSRIFKQAKITAKYSLNNGKHISYYKEIGVYQIIGQIDDDKVIEDYLEHNIKAIIDYDIKNKTNYLEIIKLYIKYDRSVKEIADLLQVHRNTINYKIKIIKEYFNLDMTVEGLARIYLAIIMNEMKKGDNLL